MLAALLAPVEITEEDRELAVRLMAEKTPEDIAASLVQAHRARLPAPEELIGNEPAEQRGPRPGFEGSQWFRMNVGRNQNADPRWVLPLLCRRDHVGRGEIGAIRIAANETMFEVPQAIAGRFLEAVGRTAGDEDDGVQIVAFEGKPREEARSNKRDNARPVMHAKPFRAGGPTGGKPSGGPGGKPGGAKKPAWRKGPDRAR